MKPFMPAASPLTLAALVAAMALLAVLPSARAQSYCASDGQPQPTQLLERFINADCADCWSDPATPPAGAGQLALDWVAPGEHGDDAPLSAVARRDATDRLEALGQRIPEKALVSRHTVRGLKSTTLRVSHGLPVADYIGASIELKPVPATARKQRWTAWLALVETVPAGTEGSPVARNLVRNVLHTIWDGRKPLLKTEQNRFFEVRSMNIAPGTNPGRLGVIGWVESEKGQVLMAAQSHCDTH